MIYALNTKDVSEHERRIIARLIRDDKHHLLGIGKKVVNVLETAISEGHYHCIYCTGRVYKFVAGTIRFNHWEDKGCMGSDIRKPAITPAIHRRHRRNVAPKQPFSTLKTAIFNHLFFH